MRKQIKKDERRLKFEVRFHEIKEVHRYRKNEKPITKINNRHEQYNVVDEPIIFNPERRSKGDVRQTKKIKRADLQN